MKGLIYLILMLLLLNKLIYLQLKQQEKSPLIIMADNLLHLYAFHTMLRL